MALNLCVKKQQDSTWISHHGNPVAPSTLSITYIPAGTFGALHPADVLHEALAYQKLVEDEICSFSSSPEPALVWKVHLHSTNVSTRAGYLNHRL